MSKRAVTWLFGSGVLAIVAGTVLELAAIWTALAGGVVVFGGQEVIQVNGGPLGWTVVGLIIAGALAIVGGTICGLIAWIGALLNTVQLQDKTWFALLLVLGLFSFGWIAMLAYVIAGPDSTRQPAVLGSASTPATA
jgi:hypothetical protein